MTTPRLLSDRYELGPALGYGGMSEVHGGRDVRLGRDVAIKVLRADLARDPQFQVRFRREAQNAAALNHPAIVAVYDTGEAPTSDVPLPYIVMEYVAGHTLRDVVRSEGPVDPSRACEMLADVCAALDFSHRHGIIHRDVKPANVMITPSGAIKVMDFGIARALSDAQPAVTQTAAVIGTAQYLSPEQARGESVDARSDVYATGCVLFELLTGRPPFTGDSPVSIAYQHVREDPRPPSQLRPGVPAELDAITLKALAKNPANRYQSAAEMREDLLRALDGQPVEAPMVMTADERTDMLTGATSWQGRTGPPADADDFAAWQDEQSDARRGRSRRRLAVLGGLLLALVILVGLFALLSPSGRSVAVPDVTGQTQDVALRTLTGAGLKPNVVQVASEATEVGRVVGTDPGQGQEVDPAAVVTMRVGRGPDLVPAPNLVGQTADQAAAIAQGAGLTLTAVPQQQDVDDPAQVGRVLAQDPAPGTPLPPGQALALTVGRLRENIPVPDVTGQTEAAARSTLESVGFVVTVSEVDGTDTAGTAVSTDPAAGTSVGRGSSITLRVSRGNERAVPNLVGLTTTEAASRLAQAGFTGGRVQQSSQSVDDPSQQGKIISQTPAAGGTAAVGDDIPVVVGRYDGGATSGGGTNSDGSGTDGGGLFPNGLFPN